MTNIKKRKDKLRVIKNFYFGGGGQTNTGLIAKPSLIEKDSIFYWSNDCYVYDRYSTTITSKTIPIRIGCCFIRTEEDYNKYKDFLEE